MKYVLLSSLFLCILSVFGRCAEPSPLLLAVKQQVDLFTKHGKDSWGPQPSELYVDGLHVDDYQPTRWQDKQRKRVMSNFASQQMWLRSLEALSQLSGEERYRLQAQACIQEAFDRLASPEGLLYWGGHLAYDLEREEAWGMWNNGHEMKYHYPWFSGMYEVNPEATRKLMESIWLRHIKDWDSLLFNRHGRISKPSAQEIRLSPKAGWNYPFTEELELPLQPSSGDLTFINTASSLIHTAFEHAALTGEPELNEWALRLAGRYWQMRDPVTGLSGFQFNERKQRDSGDKAQHQYGELLGERAREWLMLRALSPRMIDFNLMLLLHADSLPEGHTLRERLIKESVGEWLAYHRYAYRPEQREWVSISTDGQPLPVDQMTQKGYYASNYWKTKTSNGKDLQLAALAYRLQPGRETGQALYSILQGLGFDVEAGTQRLRIREEGTRNAYVLFGLVDVDKALPRLNAIEVAEQLALRMLDTHRVNGLFVPEEDRIWASINSPTPLAMLHVLARRQGIQEPLPAPFPDRGFLHAPFQGVASKNWGRTYDWHVFYNRTRAEPSTQRDPSEGK